MEKIIEVNNLSFGYHGNLVLDNVNFDIERGDYLGIIGSNGSGKSTLVKLILRILDPLNGNIKIFDKDIREFNDWSKIGYVAQRANTFNSSFPATVEEVISCNMFSKVGLFKRLEKTHKKQIEHMLEVVDMADYKNRLIGNLSGGQQQRVLIAKALVSQPEILFLDEPTIGIDAKNEEAVYCLLAKLNKEMGITIVIVTHDIGAITVHANKLACMGNNNLTIHDPNSEHGVQYLKDLYGYSINLHVHDHNCENCVRRQENA